MAQIIREIRVDVSQPNVFQAIVAKQLDCNSRFLKITLVDFGVKIEVPNTAKVTINANRPDGQSKSFKGVANDDGTITVPLAKWMLEVAGELKCDVSVINTTDNKRLTSTDFFVNVQEAANKNTDISENPDGEIRVITPTQKIDENSSDDEYPSAKAVYDLDNITASASGSAITIDSAKAPLQNLKLFGKTEQNGTPTPDAPVPLVSVGDSGRFEVGVYGKNLLQIPLDVGFTSTNRGITYTVNEDKSISVSGTPTDTTNWKNLDLRDHPKFSLPIGKYKFICEGMKNSDKLYPLLYCLKTSAVTVQALKDANVKTFTITEENKDNLYLVIGCLPDYTPQGEKLYISIIPESVTDLSYEPYTKQTLTMPYTLRSVPNTDFKDETDFNKGIVTENTIKFTFNGSENWQTHSYGFILFNYSISIKTQRCVCDKYKFVYWLDLAKSDYGICATDMHSPFICIHDKDCSTLEEFKTKLANNPITVICVRATPIETPLTETELNAYRHLMTNKGTTTILSECEDTEITYYINKPNAQAIGNIHSQVNEDYFKLQQAIITTGGSTL